MRILLTGDSLPISDNDKQSGPQMHWVEIGSSLILNSFYKAYSPYGFFSIPLPVGNIDTVLFHSGDAFYLLNATDMSYKELTNEFGVDGLMLDVANSPFEFPGEANCQP